MGRKISAATPEAFALAIAYLKRAIDKDGGEGFVVPSRAAAALAQFEGLLAKTKAEESPLIFSSWVARQLTESGRMKMLNALRRQRADAKPDRQKRRTISVAPGVYAELERLSKSMGGISVPKLLESLAAIANADKTLQAQLLKLSVAISLE